jgi:adenine deaminase
VARRQIALTVCPVSNTFVTNGSKATEIKRMLDLGIRATVHSDDPAYFRGYMNENFVCTQEEADLGPKDLVQLTRNAFESTWLPRAAKDRYLGELEAYAAR